MSRESPRLQHRAKEVLASLMGSPGVHNERSMSALVPLLCFSLAVWPHCLQSGSRRAVAGAITRFYFLTAGGLSSIGHFLVQRNWGNSLLIYGANRFPCLWRFLLNWLSLTCLYPKNVFLTQTRAESFPWTTSKF